MKENTGARADGRLPELLCAIILITGITFLWSCNALTDEGGARGKGGDKEKKGKKDKSAKEMAGAPFNGGKFEASGVAQVPGTNYILFVDDGRPDEVLLAEIDSSGQQAGNVKPLKIGLGIENPEGITSDGSYFYVVGAQSNPKRGEANSIARFAFDRATQTVTNAAAIRDFRTLLLSKVPDLKGGGEKRGQDGGLNIEGIAWDPQNNRLLLGLRSPIIGGNALILPVRLRSSDGPFSAENLDFEAGPPIQLSLDGLGIRDIQYDSKLKSFLIISGAPENQEKGEFVLWQWDGNPSPSQPFRKATLDSGMKPEGVTEMKVADGNFILIVGDASRYLKFDYTDE